MYKSYLVNIFPTNIFVLLLFTVLLSACAGTTQVEFEAAPEPELEMVPEETKEPPEEAPAEAPVEAPAEEETPEPTTQPVEIKPYSTDIVGTVEQLYGTDDPGSFANDAYIQAQEADPVLKYTVIYFDFNKSEVKPDAREILSRHARFMQARPEVVLRIEGHADQRGTSGYNLALGEYRAIAVRTILETYGVDSSRISVISFGEEQPAVDGNTEEAFKLNRRAELIYP